ncbi:helix-turn-helix domain-containing protein [Nocardioides terrisoli]|uniref:helix-turn-helix domain-containing protein n=1 Tax=Nocardioides terrisoli TaxID=3388267 RepID=UPI0037CBCE8C
MVSLLDGGGDAVSNAEIAEQLTLSRRTIEWHLRHAFHKLGITSRTEPVSALAAAQPTNPREPRANPSAARAKTGTGLG